MIDLLPGNRLSKLRLQAIGGHEAASSGGPLGPPCNRLSMIDNLQLHRLAVASLLRLHRQRVVGDLLPCRQRRRFITELCNDIAVAIGIRHVPQYKGPCPGLCIAPSCRTPHAPLTFFNCCRSNGRLSPPPPPSAAAVVETIDLQLIHTYGGSSHQVGYSPSPRALAGPW